MKNKLPFAGLIAALLTLPAPAQSIPAAPAYVPGDPEVGNPSTFLALTLSDISNQKAFIIAQNLPMSEAEAAGFWPVHRDYETELGHLTDRKLDLIERFTRHHGTMTDREAGLLAKDIFELEAKHTELKRNYFKKFTRVMPVMKAARFFQIENQLNLALDLHMKAELPLIQ